jgi:hypothetical protein
MSDDTLTVKVSEEMPVQGPLKMFVAFAGVIAAGALAWGFTSNTVTSNTRRIEDLERESRANRELLLRIDERTAEIKRQMDRSTR